MLGAQNPELLGAPEGEAHPVGRLDAELGHLQGDLEDRRHSRAVVVYAGALSYGVEVGAHHHRAVRAAPRRVGDDVRGVAHSRDGPDVQAHPRPLGLVELSTQLEADADRRDLYYAWLIQRAQNGIRAPLLALVEDDRRVVAGILG